MNLPIEIINNIAQFVDIETYNNLKLSCKFVNQKVFNYELVKKRNASLVVDIYKYAISNVVWKTNKNKSLVNAMLNNNDVYRGCLCSTPKDDKQWIKYHFDSCSGSDLEYSY
jgi:hypothetical protein